MNISGFNFKLAVFDLDETLWDCNNKLYDDAKSILATLNACGIPLYIASFNTDAEETCKLLGIRQYFHDVHFGRDKTKYQMLQEIIKKHTNITETDVAYFDDNIHNINDIKNKSHIVAVHIEGTRGLTWSHITKIKVVTVSYVSDLPDFPNFFDEHIHLSDYARVSKIRHKQDY